MGKMEFLREVGRSVSNSTHRGVRVADNVGYSMERFEMSERVRI